MAVGRLLLNRVDVSRWVDFRSVNAERSITVKESTLSFIMMIKNYQISEPLAGNYVVLEVYEDADWDFTGRQPLPGRVPRYIEFAGIVNKVTKKIAVSPDVFSYECEARDWTCWLDRKLITVEIPEETTLLEAVTLVLREVADDSSAVAYYGTNPYHDTVIEGQTINPGFFAVSLSPEVSAAFSSMHAPMLPAYSFLRVSDYFNRICEPSGFQWYVTPDRLIRFYSQLGLTSPISGDTIYEISTLERDSVRLAMYSDLELIDDISNVRNVFRFANLRVPTGTRKVLVTKEIKDAPWWVKLLLFSLRHSPFSWLPLYREAAVILTNEFYMPRVITVQEIEQTIRLWVVDLDALTDEEDIAFEDIDKAKIREITNFQLVEKGYDLEHLRSRHNTAFYCPETGELVLTTDLIDWNTQGLYITGPGVEIQHISVQDFDAIQEMRRRENSCGIYEEYIDAAEFPRNWSTADIFERLAAKYAYPKLSARMISRVPGWLPGMKFTFVGREKWRLTKLFYVMKTRKTFDTERIMKTELELCSTLY